MLEEVLHGFLDLGSDAPQEMPARLQRGSVQATRSWACRGSGPQPQTAAVEALDQQTHISQVLVYQWCEY